MKRMILTDTHIDPAGNLLLQWRKQFSDDGITWENLDFHRTLVKFAGNIDATLAAVDAHAKSMGIATGVDPKSVARIKAHATVAWSDVLPLTDAAVEARVAAESARQAELLQAKPALANEQAALATLQAELAPLQAKAVV